MGRYQSLFAQARQHPKQFWAEAASRIHWFTPYRKVLDASPAPFYRWFEGATLNTCYNAIDHPVANGRAEQLAVIYDNPVTATQPSFTFRQLLEQVARIGAIHSVVFGGFGAKELAVLCASSDRSIVVSSSRAEITIGKNCSPVLAPSILCRSPRPIRLSGDGGYIDEDGNVFIMGRIDDSIVVAGHNLSTASIEEVLASYENVAECAVDPTAGRDGRA